MFVSKNQLYRAIQHTSIGLLSLLAACTHSMSGCIPLLARPILLFTGQYRPIVVARQPNQLTVILKSPYESLGPANAYFINFIHQQHVYFACCYGNMDFTSLLGNSI